MTTPHPNSLQLSINSAFSDYADDLSLRVLQARLEYLESGRYQPFCDLVDRGDVILAQRFRWAELIRDIAEHARTRKIFIYGAGGIGQTLRHMVRQLVGVEVSGYCDRNHLQFESDLEVVDPMWLIERYRTHDDVSFLVGSEMYGQQMRDTLTSKGVLLAHVLGGSALVSEQYFDRSIVQPRTSGTFVDGGALDLATYRYHQLWSGDSAKNWKYLAFEPDSDNAHVARQVIDNQALTNCTLIAAALWDRNTQLHFQNSGNGVAHVSDVGAVRVDAVALDDVRAAQSMSFLKLDIEGAELQALRGAQRTIQRNQPTLAISVYHRPDDLWTIPKLLQQLVPDHRFYLRHHSITPAETILYAVPPV